MVRSKLLSNIFLNWKNSENVSQVALEMHVTELTCQPGDNVCPVAVTPTREKTFGKDICSQGYVLKSTT